jgi:hypothetical protein
LVKGAFWGHRRTSWKRILWPKREGS